MHLTHHAANTWAIAPDDNEQILGNESHLLIHAHDLNMSESLAVGANLILAFHDEYTPLPQNAICFTPPASVEIKNRFVILTRGLIPTHVVAIVSFKRLVRGVRGAPWCVHVRGIEYDTVQFAVLVGQFATIHPILNVGCPQSIGSGRDVPPEHPFPVSNVCDDVAGADVELKNFWEYRVVAIQGSAQNEFVRCSPVSNDALSFSTAMDDVVCVLIWND